MKMSETKVNVNFKILRFGHVQINIKGGNVVRKEARLKQASNYSEPRTTDQQKIEIIFSGEDYKIPKTTGGLF